VAVIMILIENYSNCFNLSDTGMSYYNEFIKGEMLSGDKVSMVDYYKIDKGAVGEIEYMTATEYMEKCAKIHNISFENEFVGLNKESIKKFTYMMLYGTKFHLPVLDFECGKRGTQEGRHRMMAAQNAFGENEKFPVLCIYKYKPTKEEITDYCKARWGEQAYYFLDSYLSGYGY